MRLELISAELGKKYISPPQSVVIIDDAIRGVLNISPLVLIDVKSGHLCDGPKRIRIFKSEPEFRELLASIIEQSDSDRVQPAVEKYFQYVTLSHVWEGEEPSFQDVNKAGSIRNLDESFPLNQKLRKFCEVVHTEGYRWAWSDTCCIDKTISTVLNQSLKMMYKWYESSAATFVFLVDVASPSVLGDLLKSIWMTRAWTSQELLAPEVIRFYTRDWKPYLGDNRANHKESPEIMQELADAIGVARETIISFNPDDLGVREKLRLASSRKATVAEDIAYSLIGIFKSDIRPEYGEGYAALGHLLEETVARSGDVTVLDWTGKSSPYNSCLPTTLTAYSRAPGTSFAIDSAEMDTRVEALRNLLSQTDATRTYNRITALPPARFANRRLHLPCIIFTVTKLEILDFEGDYEYQYRARVLGIGSVEFQTSDRLSLKQPRRLVLVHPWIRDLRDPLNHSTWGSTVDVHESESDQVNDEGTPHVVSLASMDTYTCALRLIVRLHQPFHPLLLQQQPNGEFKRVATEYEIVAPGLSHQIELTRDVRTEVVEIL